MVKNVSGVCDLKFRSVKERAYKLPYVASARTVTYIVPIIMINARACRKNLFVRLIVSRRSVVSALVQGELSRGLP